MPPGAISRKDGTKMCRAVVYLLDIVILPIHYLVTCLISVLYLLNPCLGSSSQPARTSYLALEFSLAFNLPPCAISSPHYVCSVLDPFLLNRFASPASFLS